MSDIDDYADPEVYMDELETDCDFGFEFCTHPDIKELGLCTTECPTYLESLEEEQQENDV